MADLTSDARGIREAVRERYAAEARLAREAGGWGCGNPVAVAELREGETVLDLGSGGGLDVILSARRVGPTGKAYGLDMTEEMLALGLENRARAGVANAEFLRGYIEDVPLPAGTVDVVLSNCVVNLSADKARAFSEMFRVLKPGGRIAITDVVADEPHPPQDVDAAVDLEAWSSCLAGALTREAYREGLRAAGFERVEVTDSHQIDAGHAGAIVRARKPDRLSNAPNWDDLDDVRGDCCGTGCCS